MRNNISIMIARALEFPTESIDFLLAYERNECLSKQLIDVHIKMLVKGLDPVVVDRSLAEIVCGMRYRS